MNNCQNSLIYVVDDGREEHGLLKLILANQQPNCGLRFFNDGTQLITQLTHCLDPRLPDLILLNLQMPVLTGYEVLILLNRDAAWKSIPVIAYNPPARTTDLTPYTDPGYITSLNQPNSHRNSDRCLSAAYLNFNPMYSDN